MTLRGIRLDINPQLDRAADWMAVILRDLGYCPHVRDLIVRYARACGTPTGAPGLDREDEEAVTEAFVEALDREPLPYDHPCWNRDVPPVAGGAPEPFEPTEEDWADYREWAEHYDRMTDLMREIEEEGP